MTGTATLLVHVGDENDNAPEIDAIIPDFPVVGKDTRQGEEVLRFTAKDSDISGQPYKFRYVCNDAKCADFTFQELASEY